MTPKLKFPLSGKLFKYEKTKKVPKKFGVRHDPLAPLGKKPKLKHIFFRDDFFYRIVQLDFKILLHRVALIVLPFKL